MANETPRTQKADKYYIRVKLDSIDEKLDTLLEIVKAKGGLKTRKTKATAIAEAEDVLKTLSPEAVSNAVAMAAAAVEEEKTKPPKKGPLQWNEFVSQYIRDQAAKGIIIKRPNAMRNTTVKQAYRNKYGLGSASAGPKTKKTNKANNETRKTKKVRVLAPANAVPVTPGRSTPPMPLARPETAPVEEEAPSVKVNVAAPVNRPKAPTPKSPAVVNTGLQGQALEFEELGQDPETELITVRIGSNTYFMVPDDNGLYRRNNNGGIGPWVGYLTNNKKIQYTNAPEE